MNPTNSLAVRTSVRTVRYFFYFFTFFGAWLLLSDLHAERALQGVLINGTNNHPVPNQKVELLVLGEGMQNNSETMTNANGQFRFYAGRRGPNPALVAAFNLSWRELQPDDYAGSKSECSREIDGLRTRPRVWKESGFLYL